MAEKKKTEQKIQEKKLKVEPVPAVVKALLPTWGRFSLFEVLVGNNRIFTGSRLEAYRKAEQYNTSHGLDCTVKEIIS